MASNDQRDGTGRGARHSGTRTTSLARGIAWGYWWRRLLGFLLFDVCLLAVFGALLLQRRGLAMEDLSALTNARAILEDELIGFYPLLAVIGGFELVSLLQVFGETRRVRRKLQPLNDLALAAEELGNAASMGADKIHSLEKAIHTASVDSPLVHTGDKDLQSIEVALNGLLRQMQEAKLQQMRFVSDASHELRTPIQVIQGYVNMLDRWGKTDEAVLDESIAALKSESQHMQDLVEQLLFLARGDSGRTTLQREELDLSQVVHEVWEESRMIDDAHVYALAGDEAGESGDDARIEISGDPSLIKQCARILVQNAAAYAPEGTTITLAVGQNGSDAFLSVEDEGIGMSQEDAAHIFERFYRADEARDRREGGTGLGLSIAQWIAEAHDGSIEVLSCEGVGTRFTVHLPA